MFQRQQHTPTHTHTQPKRTKKAESKLYNILGTTFNNKMKTRLLHSNWYQISIHLLTQYGKSVLAARPVWWDATDTAVTDSTEDTDTGAEAGLLLSLLLCWPQPGVGDNQSQLQWQVSEVERSEGQDRCSVTSFGDMGGDSSVMLLLCCCYCVVRWLLLWGNVIWLFRGGKAYLLDRVVNVYTGNERKSSW